MKKTCKQCTTEFEITDSDLAFYKKISPTFDGKTFEIPAPTLCPECRWRRRMMQRNVNNLYKGKCDLCKKEMITMYPPRQEFSKVYCRECWWSDKWDAADFGLDYDPNKRFVEQFTELKKTVPTPGLVYVDSQNSEYVNFANSNKDCYLVFLAGNNEDVCYGYWSEHSVSSADITYTNHSELCYEIIGGENCYKVFYGIDVSDCRDSFFIDNCRQCRDCILCSGLVNKQYYFENRPLSKDEYEEKKRDFLHEFEEKIKDYKQKFNEIVLSRPKKFAQMTISENCSGDYIERASNCRDCSNIFECQDCFHSQDLRESKDSADLTGFGIPVERVYESQNVGLGTSRCSFINFAYQLSDSYYSEHCYYCSDLFGCIGLKNHKKYFILNKEYQKEEYEKIVADILKNMSESGEWGEFFPKETSWFCYNETMANDYSPLTKEDALRLGYKWQDRTNDIEFSGEFYKPKSIATYQNDEQERKKILSGVLKCEISGRPYKIVPRELAFYMQHNLPIPKVHYEIRMKKRFSLRNSYKLYHRQCMCEESDHGHEGRCTNEFETTYAPDRPEKVYCEECYQKR